MSSSTGTGGLERSGLWLRMMDDGTALLLPTIVEIEPTDDGAYCATIDGLGDTLIGMGGTEEEAVEAAYTLLHGRVDHAIENGKEFSKVLGDMAFVIVPEPVLHVRPHRRQPQQHYGAPARDWSPAVLAAASA